MSLHRELIFSSSENVKVNAVESYVYTKHENHPTEWVNTEGGGERERERKSECIGCNHIVSKSLYFKTHMNNGGSLIKMEILLTFAKVNTYFIKCK